MRVIAASLGDPAGVGPELLAECWARREVGTVPFFAVGGAHLLTAAAASRGIALPIERVFRMEDAAAAFDKALPVFGDLDGDWQPGQPDETGARLALASLTDAAALAASGEASAIVTGPIAKSRLAAVGFAHPGQTEFVARACGVADEDAVMMLAGPSLRTVPLTVHVALAAVPETLTTGLIVRRARIVARALIRDFGIGHPRLAVAALNPHAGEDGRMGDEEVRIIAPAIAVLQAEGLAVTGPHPADALFAPRARDDYDVALCMYHDQALIPLKTLDFDAGVNVTLGLPTIRTSPDHGTAFAIAGRNLAHPGATLAALAMAGTCVRHRAA
jgi:4-hydroxythreonine-4-phosphate dehydrogenase